jgi:hypothetical protein
VQPSPELKDLTLRFFQAAVAGDTAFIERAYSRQPGTLQIGTDPTEWWHGWETITGIWRSQIEALGGSMPVFANDVEAWQEGDVGWAAANGAIRVPEQPATPLRLTAVFRREDGEWRVVQGHGSIGVPNVETTFGDVPT